jgi:hypothetical protein
MAKIKLNDLSKKGRQLTTDDMKKVTGGARPAEDITVLFGKKKKGGLNAVQKLKLSTKD